MPPSGFEPAVPASERPKIFYLKSLFCIYFILSIQLYHFFFTCMPCSLILSNFFYTPSDAQVNCLKKILKSTIKLTLKQLRHVSVQSHHHQGAHYSCLLKLQLLKQPIKIYRCVVMWLHILFGSCRCVYIALFGSRRIP